jgi:opacity protein-like surface antigen
MKKMSIVFIAMLYAFNTNAADGSKSTIDAKKIYFGGGLGLNSLSGIDLSDAIGFQVFAGYELPVEVGDGTLSVEVGYMDSGNFDGPGKGKAKGVWANAVVSLPLQNKLSVIGRAGLDLGDDDGLMLGGGLGFQANEKMEIRAEYVIRDNVDSLQLNLVIRQ